MPLLLSSLDTLKSAQFLFGPPFHLGALLIQIRPCGRFALRPLLPPPLPLRLQSAIVPTLSCVQVRWRRMSASSSSSVSLTCASLPKNEAKCRAAGFICPLWRITERRCRAEITNCSSMVKLCAILRKRARSRARGRDGDGERARERHMQ